MPAINPGTIATAQTFVAISGGLVNAVRPAPDTSNPYKIVRANSTSFSLSNHFRTSLGIDKWLVFSLETSYVMAFASMAWKRS